MSSIFISHASSDLKEALEIKSQLTSLGFDVWMAAEDIKAGVNFAEEITKSINNSDAIVVLLTPESIASPHVKREVNLTIDRKKFLVPVLLGAQKDFVATLPEDWKYWLTVVQILNFKGSELTSLEISNVLKQKLNSTDSDTYINKKKSLGSKIKDMSLVLKSVIVVLSLLFVIFIIGALQSNGSSQVIDTSSTETKVDTSAPTKVIVAKASMMATDSSNELPAFPTAVVDYELAQVIKSADSWQLRLFGEDWQTVDYFADGTQMNSCNDQFWVFRWRAEASDSKIKSATGYIDNETHVFSDKTEQGGAGYISGFGCEAPFLISAAAPTNILEDINYELQIWKYKPGI